MLCGSGVKDCIEGPRPGWGGQLWECCGDSVTILWVCLGYSVLLSPVRTACQTCVQARIDRYLSSRFVDVVWQWPERGSVKCVVMLWSLCGNEVVVLL